MKLPLLSMIICFAVCGSLKSMQELEAIAHSAKQPFTLRQISPKVWEMLTKEKDINNNNQEETRLPSGLKSVISPSLEGEVIRPIIVDEVALDLESLADYQAKMSIKRLLN